MAPSIDVYARGAVLGIASRLTTDRHDPAKVCENALPLLGWLDAATGDNDRRARLEAMERQDTNVRHLREENWRVTGPVPPRTDDPEGFLDDARALYALLVPEPVPA